VRLVFCGTPSFAVPTLHAVLAAGHDVPLVLTQPDRPSGRGLALLPPAVKLAALAAGPPVLQPDKIRNNPDLRAHLEALAPDAILVVAYGRIIPPWMLDLPPLGNLNLHGSLLPQYRGAAPIQWAIANGESTLGVTTMRLDQGLDTGDILLQRSLPIPDSLTAQDAFPLLADLGAPLMVETLDALARSALTPRPQDHSAATLAPLLTRDDGRVDFSRPARDIYNRWRGFQPWPGAWTTAAGRKLTLSRILPANPADPAPEPAAIAIHHHRVFAGCAAHSAIELLEVQPEGRKRMSAADFARGGGLHPGDRLG
jgi:methionyl-tRNA formyltransferase